MDKLIKETLQEKARDIDVPVGAWERVRLAVGPGRRPGFWERYHLGLWPEVTGAVAVLLLVIAVGALRPGFRTTEA